MTSRSIINAGGSLINNRWVAVAVSGILIFTALSEVFVFASNIGAHHGVLLFGIFNLVKTLPDFHRAASVLKKTEGG